MFLLIKSKINDIMILTDSEECFALPIRKGVLIMENVTAQSLGFELAHIGVNTANEEEALKVANLFDAVLGAGVKNGNSSVFVGSCVEVMKTMYLGANGHIAIRTNDIVAAIAFLESKGFPVDMETAKYKGEKMVAVYLKGEFGGFALHLLQK